MEAHSLTTPLSGSVHSKEAQCLSGWCFKSERTEKFAGYSFTGLPQKHLHLCVWAQSNAVRAKEEVPSHSAGQFCWRWGDFKGDSFPPASQAQTESKHANPSQICSVQLTCALSFLSKSKGNCSGSLLREDKIPDLFFFFITMSAFPCDWGLQLFQNQNQILQSHLKTIILGQIPEGAECLQLPLHSWGTKCA